MTYKVVTSKILVPQTSEHEVIVCDNCQVEKEFLGLHHWDRAKDLSDSGYLTLLYKEISAHFCSGSCLVVWMEGKINA